MEDERHREVPLPGTTIAPTSRLDWLHVSLFGSVMGLTGMSLAWRLAHELLGSWIGISWAFETLAVLAFLLISLGYIAKMVTARATVVAEFFHPIAGNFFSTLFISIVLLPSFIVPISLQAARAVWLIGALSTSIFALFIVNRWMRSRQQVANATPGWLIPVVGLLNVPLAMPSLGLASLREVMVPYLALGLFFTVPIFTLIFHRLLFEPPLAGELQPSLLILVAPFAVGTSTYIVATGNVDHFADALFTLAVFMLAVLVDRLWHLGACCPFTISWWGVSFPLATTAIAAMRIALAHRAIATDALAVALLVFATAVVTLLIIQTAWRLARGELS